MLRKPETGDRARAATGRITALDRARTFITLLVLIHHSAVNYTHFGSGDKMRWLGFDLVVLFNDSFFMACMFLISGLFVHDSLTRRGASNYLQHRAWRLGIPFLISIFVLMPIAYYPTFLRYHLPGTTDFNFFHFWWHTLTIGPWPSGPAWFLWVLLALDIAAAALWALAPRMLKMFGLLIFSLRDRPWTAFAAFLAASVVIYVPMRLLFGEASWLEPGGYPLPIQTSRILLYAGYFLTGVGIGVVSLRAGILSEEGELARRWPVWLAFASLFYGAILLLVYARHNWIADFDSPPLSWQSRLWPCLCAIQRRNDVHGAGRVPGLRLIEHEAARCHAAAGLRHLSDALRLHHLAAIRRLRLFMAGLRQVRYRLRRHAGAKLGGHGAVAENSGRGADDLDGPDALNGVRKCELVA